LTTGASYSQEAAIDKIGSGARTLQRRSWFQSPVSRLKRKARRTSFGHQDAIAQPSSPGLASSVQTFEPLRDTCIRCKSTHPSPSAREFRLLLNGLATSALRRMFCSDEVLHTPLGGLAQLSQKSPKAGIVRGPLKRYTKYPRPFGSHLGNPSLLQSLCSSRAIRMGEFLQWKNLFLSYWVSFWA
jgi:hypothetical protein